MRVDVVGERERVVYVARVPLHSQLDLMVLFSGFEVDDLRVDGILLRVDVLDEVDDAAVVAVGDAPGLVADQSSLRLALIVGGDGWGDSDGSRAADDARRRDSERIEGRVGGPGLATPGEGA